MKAIAILALIFFVSGVFASAFAAPIQVHGNIQILAKAEAPKTVKDDKAKTDKNKPASLQEGPLAKPKQPAPSPKVTVKPPKPGDDATNKNKKPDNPKTHK